MDMQLTTCDEDMVADCMLYKGVATPTNSLQPVPDKVLGGSSDRRQRMNELL